MQASSETVAVGRLGAVTVNLLLISNGLGGFLSPLRKRSAKPTSTLTETPPSGLTELNWGTSDAALACSFSNSWQQALKAADARQFPGRLSDLPNNARVGFVSVGENYE